MRSAASAVPIQIGFNRRYDAGHRAVAETVRAGEIGTIEQLIITIRDPSRHRLSTWPCPVVFTAT